MELNKKTCVQCKIEKPIGGFRKYSNGIIGNSCKSCLNEMDKQRKKNLRKKHLETAIYKCNLCNVDKFLKDFAKLKKNYKKKVCLDCYPTFLKNEKNQYNANERVVNINYRIKKSLAARLRAVLQKENTTMSYIGCPIQYLREWLEYNFTPEMNWNNYGTYWHIDHIIPVACFDLTNETQKMICWNWTNLAPLKKSTNCSKKSLINELQIKFIKDKLIKFKEEGSTTKWFSDDYIVLLQPFETITARLNTRRDLRLQQSAESMPASIHNYCSNKVKTI